MASTMVTPEAEKRPMSRMSLIVLFLLTTGACAPEGNGNDGRAEGVSAAPGAAARVTPASVEQARGVVRAFHRALSEADSASALGLLHPDVIIYESGHAETVDEYRAGHLPADMRFAAATEREVVSESTMALGEGVLYLARTRVRGTMGEREIDSGGVETMVLARDGDDLLIRHIHWSAR